MYVSGADLRPGTYFFYTQKSSFGVAKTHRILRKSSKPYECQAASFMI